MPGVARLKQQRLAAPLHSAEGCFEHGRMLVLLNRFVNVTLSDELLTI